MIQHHGPKQNSEMTMDDGAVVPHDDPPTTPIWKPRHKVLVGVIGGIGPAASAHLYQTIVQLRARTAQQDDDHIPLLIYNNPQIPNNNAAVRGLGPPSVPAMVYTARALQRAGATHVVLPCNTAHVFADAMQTELRRLEAEDSESADTQSLQFIHMLELTAHKVVDTLRKARMDADNGDGQNGSFRVGLMGTIGTLQSKIYHKVLDQVSRNATLSNDESTFSIQVIPPVDLNTVQTCISRIKAGDYRKEEGAVVQQLLSDQLNALVSEEKVDAIVLGCTELPLVLTPERCLQLTSVAVLDPLHLLAMEIIRLTEASEENATRPGVV